MSEREGRSSRGRDDDDAPRGGRGSSGSGFRYRSRDPDKVKQRAEHGGGATDVYIKDELSLWKPAQKDNDVRILPPTWEDADHYGCDIHIHYGIGPDNAAYLCIDKMKNKACPICEERKRALDRGETEYADELRPQRRVLYYMVDRKKEKDGLQVWGVGNRMDQDILRLCVDAKTGETLEIDHPEKGYDLQFVRDGEGMKTRYTGFQISRRSSPLDNDKALEFAVEHPLPSMLVFYSYDHIKTAFAGRKVEKEDEPAPAQRKGRDDDEKPAERGRSSRDEDEAPVRRSKPADVDLTWDEVHELSFRKLSALCEEHKLKVDPDSTKDDEELADAICDELDIKKKRREEPREENSTRTKLNRLRD